MNNLGSLGNVLKYIRGIQPIDQSKHSQTGHIMIQMFMI